MRTIRNLLIYVFVMTGTIVGLALATGLPLEAALGAVAISEVALFGTLGGAALIRFANRPPRTQPYEPASHHTPLVHVPHHVKVIDVPSRQLSAPARLLTAPQSNNEFSPTGPGNTGPQMDTGERS